MVSLASQGISDSINGFLCLSCKCLPCPRTSVHYVSGPYRGEGQGEGGNAAREVGSVHRMFMATCHLRTRERVKGNTAFPFTIPAAPQRNRCFALRSPPAPLPAVGLTRRPVSTNLSPPSLAACPCHRVFVSPISAGTQLPRCTLCARGAQRCRCGWHAGK
jgi:hypothetical protein